MGWTSGGGAAASRPWGGGAVSGKQFVLAAMIGTLALVAIACSVAVVLSPGHIFFGASVSVFLDNSRGSDDGTYLMNIIIVANNTSKHAHVCYRSMKTEVWLDDGEWIPVDFDNITSVGFSNYNYWPPATSTELSAQMKVARRNALKEKDQGNHNQKPNEKKNGYFTVVIKTQVQFRYGFAPTRPYDIHVTCPSSDLASDYDNLNGTETSTSTGHDNQGRPLDLIIMSINDACA